MEKFKTLLEILKTLIITLAYTYLLILVIIYSKEISMLFSDFVKHAKITEIQGLGVKLQYNEEKKTLEKALKKDDIKKAQEDTVANPTQLILVQRLSEVNKRLELLNNEGTTKPSLVHRWLFAGTYLQNQKKWKKKYLDLKNTPAIGESATALVPINIRDNYPVPINIKNDEWLFGNIIDAVEQNQSIKIINIQTIIEDNEILYWLEIAGTNN